MLLIDRRPTGAGRAALRAFRGLPASARGHAAVRWWSAPLPRVAQALPATGRVLEIGCGHGLFSAFAALSGARSVVGVDIDADKIALAQRVAANLPAADLTFRVAESGAVPTGPWDAIVVVDVLYLLPAAAQRSLLADAVAQLAPDGVLLVKEMSPTPRWKARWNRWQETMAVSVLGITERATARDDTASGEPFTFVDPSTMAGWLGDAGLWTAQQRLDRRRLHPHHLLLARASDPAIP
ncbi:class I SAM-dependent methyltransferase [Nakamurella sp.]|uniref:class I SAM-dependent methyltransferase n=1 Tax=Nakamurella sp. TaxID=1869182 RepID=UPI0037852E0C